MRLVLVTDPALEPVPLTEARLHLRVDPDGSPPSHPDDDLITALIVAARQQIDGRNGWLGRAIITQTWDLLLPYFSRAITLPLPPLQSVTHIKYYDTSNALQTMDSADYRVIAGEPAVIEVVDCWPYTYCSRLDAVQVRFVTGYGDDPEDVPELIRAWIKLAIGDMYRDRETSVVGTTISNVPNYTHLLENYRIR